MAERIFINYRRDDSAGHAGRLFDRLKAEFGQDVLFMDVDAIPLGANFVLVLREEVAKCSALLAIIGPNWLNAKDEDGVRRLDNSTDFVRVEIAAALQRDIPVIPILLEGARIPKAHILPDDLKELSRNGLDVRHASFHADMDKLVRGLRTSSKAQTKLPQTSTRVTSTDTRVPSVDEVIGAKGKWVEGFGVDPKAKTVPDIFGHCFMLVEPYGPSYRDARVGAIVTGLRWDSSNYPFWTLIHGYGVEHPVIHFDYLAYLGSTWRPEYAALSGAVFKKFGAKPLERFVEHP